MPIAHPSVLRAAVIALLGAVLVACFAPPAQGAVNRQVSFQGRLVDGSGIPVADGAYNVELKLHNHATNTGGAQGACSGSCIWRETRTGASQVTVSRGLFSIQLGEVASLAAVDFDQATLYVSVRLGGTGAPVWDAEMTPRSRLAAAPQAIHAAVASDVTCADCITAADLAADSVTASELATGAVTSTDILDGTIALGDLAPNSVDSSKIVDGSVALADMAAGVAVPIGMVSPFWGPSAPTGYLLANGASVSCATYPLLCAVWGASGSITLPDLRGRSAIGVDAGAGRVTANNALGQAAGAQTHTLTAGEMPYHEHQNIVGWGAGGGSYPYWDGSSGRALYGMTSNTGGAGGGAPHNNMQPYQVLNYIVRVA